MTFVPTPVPPFVLPAWVDPDAVLADAMAVLRMSGSDPDVARLQTLVSTAAALVDAWLDRGTSPLPDAPPMHPLAQFGTTQVTVELYRRKDAPFGVLNAWSPDEVVTRISNDPIRGAFNVLLPLKGGFGVAG